QDPVAYLDPFGVAEPGGGEAAAAVVELQYREIGLLVGADDLRLVLAAVGADDLDRGRALDHVRVRQRDAGRVDDHAGAEAALRDALGELAEEPLEELFAEELLEGRAPEGPAPADRVDVDHRRLDRLGDPGERVRLERDLGGDRGQRRGIGRGRARGLAPGGGAPADHDAE